jgi:uncharacterized protein
VPQCFALLDLRMSRAAQSFTIICVDPAARRRNIGRRNWESSMAVVPLKRWQGKWALVTGASAGIGAALATELAAGGANLVLTARRKDRLVDLATKLAAQEGIRVEVCIADLEQESGPQEIFSFTHDRGIEIELLINNAGFGAFGEFVEMDESRLLGMVKVNVAAVVHLTHLFLPSMIARRSGDILILASVAAFQGVPFMATYSATKAFDLIFAEALAEEVVRHGIRVCALCPGTTESEFHDIARRGVEVRIRKGETAEKVAHVGLVALVEGKSSVISGAKNILGAEVQRLLPRRFVTRTVAKMYGPPKNSKV